METKINLPVDFRLHHIGYATKSIKADIPFFESLGYKQEGSFFEDFHQGIRGCFLTSTGSRIELLENLPVSKTLDCWLRSGIRLYHLAYLAPNLENALSWTRTNRGIVVSRPTSAVAFEGRRVTFVMMRNNLLLEFIELE